MNKQHDTEDIVELFKALVSIDSPSKEEVKVSQYLTTWAQQQGYLVKQDEYGNLIITTKQDIPAKVFFSAHMDTVEPGRGIVCVEDNGFLKSAGDTILGADNKASLAGIIHALSTFKKEELPCIELVFTTEEESFMNAQHIKSDSITAPYGFIFDAPFEFGGIIMSSPFIEDFVITLKGEATHASTPDEGLSVISTLQYILEDIPTGFIEGKQELGTINIGLVTLGTGVNTVPGNCELKGELRSVHESVFTTQKEHIQNVVTSLQDKFSGYEIQCEFKNYAPGYLHNEHDQVVLLAKQAIENIGRTPRTFSPQSVSDANHFNIAGKKTLVISEGTKFAHTTNETISVTDLQDISNLVKEIIKQISLN